MHPMLLWPLAWHLCAVSMTGAMLGYGRKPERKE